MGAGGCSFPILAKTEIKDAFLEFGQNLRSRFIEHTPKMPECILENNGLSSYLFALLPHRNRQTALDWQNGGARLERNIRDAVWTVKNTGIASGALEASGAGALPNMQRHPSSAQTAKKDPPPHTSFLLRCYPEQIGEPDKIDAPGNPIISPPPAKIAMDNLIQFCSISS